LVKKGTEAMYMPNANHLFIFPIFLFFSDEWDEKFTY